MHRAGKEHIFVIMNVREYTEEQEQKNLMPWSCKSKESHRLAEEPQDDLRTAFQRDRDQIGRAHV